MLHVAGGPLVYMNDKTGELWAKICIELECAQCFVNVVKTIDVPLRNNVFVGCNRCKSTKVQIQFQLR